MSLNPKEKAVELFDKFYHSENMIYVNEKIRAELVIEHSLICVRDIIEATKVKKHFLNRSPMQFKWVESDYWKEVEEELKKL